MDHEDLTQEELEVLCADLVVVDLHEIVKLVLWCPARFLLPATQLEGEAFLLDRCHDFLEVFFDKRDELFVLLDISHAYCMIFVPEMCLLKIIFDLLNGPGKDVPEVGPVDSID